MEARAGAHDKSRCRPGLACGFRQAAGAALLRVLGGGPPVGLGRQPAWLRPSVSRKWNRPPDGTAPGCPYTAFLLGTVEKTKTQIPVGLWPQQTALSGLHQGDGSPKHLTHGAGHALRPAGVHPGTGCSEDLGEGEVPRALQPPGPRLQPCTHAHTLTHAHSHVYTHTCTQTHTHSHTRPAHVYSHTQNIHNHVYTYTHTLTHAHSPRVYTHVHTHTYSCTLTDAHVHTCVHAHTHIHSQTHPPMLAAPALCKPVSPVCVPGKREGNALGPRTQPQAAARGGATRVPRRPRSAGARGKGCAGRLTWYLPCTQRAGKPPPGSLRFIEAVLLEGTGASRSTGAKDAGSEPSRVQQVQVTRPGC